MSDAAPQPRGRQFRHIGWWMALLSVGVVFLIALVTIALVQRREAQISPANYAWITTGMDVADVYRLLGAPGYSKAQLGLVNAPEGDGAYSVNFTLPAATLRKRGYENYLFLQWTSPDLTIHVVVDTGGKVATRYTSEGQDLTLFQRIAHLFDTIP